MTEPVAARRFSRRLSSPREEVLAAAREVGVRLKGFRVLAPIVTTVARQLEAMELRHLADVLSTTPLAGCHWMWSGALLGWAREGRFLAHDTADIDFAYRWEDTEKLIASVPLLEKAGFKLEQVLRRNDGLLTGVRLVRSGIHFDFQAAFPVEDRWQVYSSFEGVQITQEVPAQELVEFEFCNRRWLKVVDHQRELACLYGDWRTPKRDWNTVRDSPAVVAREPSRRPPCDPQDLSIRV